MASLIAFTTTWIFTSLLPQTSKAAPLFAFNNAAVFSIPLTSFTSAKAGEVTDPPSLANNASAIAPVSEGLCVKRSSALLPVRLIILSK